MCVGLPERMAQQQSLDRSNRSGSNGGRMNSHTLRYARSGTQSNLLRKVIFYCEDSSLPDKPQ